MFKRKPAANIDQYTSIQRRSKDQEKTSSTSGGLVEDKLQVKSQKNVKKLFSSNGGPIKISRPTVGYINLKDIQPERNFVELLQFGLNYHVLSKPKPYKKRVEIDVLLEQIQHLAKDGKVKVKPNVQPELISEANHNRGSFTSKLQRHFDTAKRLGSNKDITVRRADKAAVFVPISTDEYLSKIDYIFRDPTKFKRINRDPTLDITRSTKKDYRRH
ncbi:uncharacterized protein LOC143032205 [Oratosquilla oratoria]|uniref:uncharacterized protein LOC143032205 n=1 Tax=Oratosquilla oratoria TaxID=337810 RepID=UPI003F76B51A